MSLFVKVKISDDSGLVREYVIDHDDPVQRRTLGEQCRNAFEAGQSVETKPVKQRMERAA